MIGIFVGITAVVSLISLGQGLQVTIDDQFQKVGGDRIMVSPGGGGLEASFGMSELVAAKLGNNDLNVIREVRGVDSAVGVLTTFGEIRYKDKKKTVSIFAFPADPESQKYLEQMDFFVVDRGRYLREGDKYKALVGVDTGESNFGKDIGIGDKLIIKGHEFKIVGVNKKTGNPTYDTKVTIPLEAAEGFFNKSDEFSMIYVKVKKGFEPSDVAEDIKKKLRRHRGVKEGEEDFSVDTAENLVASFKTALLVVQVALVGIAAISLIVGGIGIMTTMYTAILERTRQIGIMKAIGARNSDILLLFLIESSFLGTVGGIIGIIFGFLVGKVAEQLAAYYGIEIFRAYFSIELVIGALAFSFISGCISGILPAHRASKLNPVEALSYR